MPQMKAVSALTKFLQIRNEEVGQRLICEAISLTLNDDSSSKLTRAGEPNKFMVDKCTDKKKKSYTFGQLFPNRREWWSNRGLMKTL